MYPIRRSNKPPYIYAKKLVIIGLALLLATLPIAMSSMYVTTKQRFLEEGIITGATSSIPRKLPPASILASLSPYETTLTLKGLNPACNAEVIIAVKGSNKTLVRNLSEKGLSIRLGGQQFFKVFLPSRCSARYTYSLDEVVKPYGFMAFISILTSGVGASCGVIGMLLWIAKRRLEEREKKYLPT